MFKIANEIYVHKQAAGHVSVFKKQNKKRSQGEFEETEP